MIGTRFIRRDSALLEQNTLGRTNVSYAVLTQIAERSAKSKPEVKSCKAKTRSIGNSVRIEVRVVTPPTVSLPEMTHSLEDAIAASILQICGTAIGSVDVTVDQTDNPSKRA